MKEQFFSLLTVLLLAAGSMFGQGEFVVDQLSSTYETPIPGSGTLIQQLASPWGQSFTPSLSAVDFVRFKFSDGDPGNGLGMTMYVNVLSDSITGTVLGSTEPVFMVDGFAGVTNFIFPSTVSLSSGVMYYLAPVVQSGDPQWGIDIEGFNYGGGNGYSGGVAGAGDLWFQEGIVVPEPASLWLTLLSGGLLLYVRRFKQRAFRS